MGQSISLGFGEAFVLPDLMLVLLLTNLNDVLAIRLGLLIVALLLFGDLVL